MNLRARSITSLSAVVTTAAILGSVALVEVNGASGASGSSAAAPASVNTSHLSSILVDNFSAVARPASPADALPASVQLPGFEVARYGLDAASSRQYGTADRPMWLVPGASGACAELPAGGACTSADLAVSGAFVSTLQADPAADTPIEVIALLPDNVTQATVIRTDGSRAVVSLVGRTVQATVGGQPAALEMTTADGSTREVPV